MTPSDKILILDDEPTNVALLERIFRRAGYSALESLTEPRKAIAAYQRFEPDLLLLDLHMPDMNGLEIIRQLKRLIPDDDYQPVLVLTADATTETKHQALAEGATDFLTKPFDTSEVLLRVGNLLRTRRLHVQLREYNATLEHTVHDRTRELEVALRQLQQAESIRDEIVSNTSHELRTPLVPIMGLADLLMSRDTWTAAEVKEHARTISRSARRLLAVVESLMRVATIRREPTTPLAGSIELASLLGEIQAIPRSQGRPVRTSIAPEAATAIADERYIREILHHLVDNAMKFTPAGSPVEIDARKQDNLIIRVIDHGPGVPEEDRERAFNSFEQLDGSETRAHGGLGAGLYIAKTLVHAHQGDINITDTPGGGATVTFTIPQPA